MRIVVLAALYFVVIAALLFAATGVYSLVSFWDAKVQLGTATTSMIKIAAVIILGAGVPYCLIRYIRR